MDINFILDEVYCNSESNDPFYNTYTPKKRFIQRKPTKEKILTVYDNCIVFTKLAFDFVNNYSHAHIIGSDNNDFIITLNNESVGTRITKSGAQPRINVPNLAIRFEINLGKYNYTIEDNKLIFDI